MQGPVLVDRVILIAEVADTTALRARVGDDALALLEQRRCEIAAELCTRWGGQAVERAADLVAVFRTANDALAFARAYHLALAGLSAEQGEPYRVRIGLHAGSLGVAEPSAAERVRGAPPLALEGLNVALTGRVAAIARGGRTLVTAAVRGSAGPGAMATVAQGLWRLRGVADPLELFEVVAEGPVWDAADPAPLLESPRAHRVARVKDEWVPAGELSGSLLRPLDAFVGRAREELELSRRVEAGRRWLSLVGLGGAGKTRLAQQWVWHERWRWPGGAWFVDLTDARSEGDVARSVAQALGLVLGSQGAEGAVIRALAAREPTVLVLDNLEQVPGVGACLERWVAAAPPLTVVATSRRVLEGPSEDVFTLGPLRWADAALLFEQRAKVQLRGWVVPTDERPALERLVRDLDGLPLAVELASARLRVVPLAELARNMEDRFLALRSGPPGRHSTLRGVFDASWEPLRSQEQAVLAQVSVFEGGFDRAAAEAVVDLPTGELGPALDVLVAVSFLRQTDDGRYHLLSTVQEYARERLAEEGPGRGPAAAAATERRHAAHFAGLTADEIDRLGLRGLRAARRRLFDNEANVRAVLARCIARGDWLGAQPAARLVAFLALARGPFEEAVAVLEPLARHLSPTEMDLGLWQALGEAYLRVQLVAAGLAVADRLDGTEHPRAGAVASLLRAQAAFGEVTPAGFQRAKSLFEVAAARGREIGDHHQVVRALQAQVVAASESGPGGQPEVRPLAFEAMALAERVGADTNLALLHQWVFNAATADGRFDEAEVHLKAAEEAARAADSPRLVALMAANEASLALAMGDLSRARRAAREAHEALSAMGDLAPEVVALLNLGVAELRSNRPTEARRVLERALQLSERAGLTLYAGFAEVELARLATREALWEEAWQRLERARPVVAGLRQPGHRARWHGLRALVLQARGAVAEAEGEGALAWRLARELPFHGDLADVLRGVPGASSGGAG